MESEPQEQEEEPGEEPEYTANDYLQAAMAGRYKIALLDLLDEALDKTSGFIGYYWLAFVLGALLFTVFLILVFAILFLIFAVGIYYNIQTPRFISDMLMVFSSVVPLVKPGQLLSQMLTLIVFSPFYAGWWMLAINYVTSQKKDILTLFRYYKKTLPIWLVTMWISLITLLTYLFAIFVLLYFIDLMGFTFLNYFDGWLQIMLINLPVTIIYLTYFFTIPLLVDRNFGALQAIKITLKVVRRHLMKVVFSLMLINVLSIILPAAAIILMGIVLHKVFWVLFLVFIWLLPFNCVCTALMYRNIFGVATTPE